MEYRDNDDFPYISDYYYDFKRNYMVIVENSGDDFLQEHLNKQYLKSREEYTEDFMKNFY